MKKIIFIISIFIALSSCTELIKEDSIPILKSYEDYVYELLQDISSEAKTIKKGEKIKIMIKYSGSWIKVYGYNYDMDILKSERVLILYMFKEDFISNIFSKDFFMYKLGKYIKVAKTGKK